MVTISRANSTRGSNARPWPKEVLGMWLFCTFLVVVTFANVSIWISIVQSGDEHFASNSYATYERDRKASAANDKKRNDRAEDDEERKDEKKSNEKKDKANLNGGGGDRNSEESSLKKPPPKPPRKRPPRETMLMKEPKIEKVDMYAGAWYQSTVRFLEPSKTKLQDITNLESATHVTMARNKWGDVRMTVDWLDFCVEHLSKWWVVSGLFDSPIDTVAIDVLTTRLGKYVAQTPTALPTAQQGATARSSTISLTPFVSWKRSDKPERAHRLSVFVLAATLASLVRMGIGRAVVAVLDSVDVALVQEAVQICGDGKSIRFVTEEDQPPPEDAARKMDVTCIVVDLPSDDARSALLPKVALLELRAALNQTSTATHQRKWLGGASENTEEGVATWDYVFFIEADTIVNSRPSAWETLRRAMDDQDAVLIPHRLTAVPHEADVGNIKEYRRYISATPPAVDGEDGGYNAETSQFDRRALANITVLTQDDACCDAGNFRPGQKPHIPHCGNFWYLCDFGHVRPDDGTQDTLRHKRLVPYGFLRLQGGTGIITLAGSESARRCIPQKQANCPA